MLDKLLDNSYLVICLLGIVLLILFKLRRSVMHRETKTAISIGESQIKGRRDEQEDSFATASNANGILAVLADGMGGYSGGKQASRLVVDTFLDEFNHTEIDSVSEFFKNTSVLCNNKLLAFSKETRTGSTLAAAMISKGYLDWVSIGDSAIILFRNGEICNLNKKHNFKSMLEEQYQSGKISKRELLQNPRKNLLTSYIGYEGFHDIEQNKTTMKLLPGDQILLCSDGVYNSLTEMELEKILSLGLKPDKTVDKVMESIQKKNYHNQDNATLIILEFN